MKKYLNIMTLSMKNSTTYLKDFVIGNTFIILIIIVYILLWSVLYSQNIQTGFTFKELIWYMIINQVVFSNNMDLFRKIETDIKTGNIAYHLNKPYYYPAFMLFDSLGKIILSFSVNLIFGVTLGLLFLGTIPSITLINLIPILTMMFLGIILNTVIYILISMTSFWFEENRPFVWIYRQLIFAFGGFLVPLTLFPKGLYNVMINMPWSYVSYHTSSNAVKFSFNGFLSTVCWQVFYIGLVFLLILVTFRKGAEKLNVNGG